jgi:L-aspartate oxidase
VTAGVHPMVTSRRGMWCGRDRRACPDGRSVCVSRRTRHDGFKRRFPTVTAACRAAGIDPTRELDSGRAGRALQLRRRGDGRIRPHRNWRACCGREVARTGLHGANRLASNSLLRVWSSAAGRGRTAAAHAVDAGPSRAMLPELSAHRALPRADLQRGR